METMDPRVTLQNFLLAVKIGFPILLITVVFVLAKLEQSRYRNQSERVRKGIR
jgi:cytochrome c-type biogenesis protein CcmH/NrfF